jgi:CheY-like chemotaxis protein
MPATDPTRTKRIFIIDDDVEDQEIFMEAVKEVDSSIACFASTNGEQALEQLAHRSIHPDLIFLDLNMPKLNGKQVLAKIKNIPTAKNIPVIMYSTSFAPRDLEEIRHVGAVHHLLKPSRFDDLCIALRELINKKW